ncbi:MAG: energy transducer TonB [Bacteroidota bacterium]
MEAKKNPKSNLKKNSTLYFLIGLTTVLMMSYTVIEWKTFDREVGYDPELNKPEVIDEILPPVVVVPKPPKPKIKTPPVIEVVKDHEIIDETVIESDDINQDTEIAEVSEIEVVEINEPEEVPFWVIEDAPIFPGCENVKDKKACFQEMMLKHIRRNFKYPEIAQEMGLQGRVNIVFTIQKNGSIGEIKMRGPHESLETEAARIISKLPKMTPGKQRGNAVKVPFSIPITFKLN